MLDWRTLRSGDPELIVKYSDLQLPDMDKRLLELRQVIDERQAEKKRNPAFGSNEKALRLYTMLQGMGSESGLLEPLIENAFQQYPALSLPELSRIILDWYSNQPKANKLKTEKVKPTSWHTLPSDDLRFKFSQAEKGRFYQELQYGQELFDVSTWLKRVS